MNWLLIPFFLSGVDEKHKLQSEVPNARRKHGVLTT